MSEAALDAVGIHLGYSSRGGLRWALKGVDLQVMPGQTVAVVGESGSGKTSLGKALVGLIRPQRGHIRILGHDQEQALEDGSLPRQIQMIFQDPFGSLNPRRNAMQLVAEGLENMGNLDRQAIVQRVRELLHRVGLDSIEDVLTKYPHSFSGGQRQRLGIARALATSPQILVADEPTSALDVSLQKEILELLAQLVAHESLTLILITHDLPLAFLYCRDIVVMYQGTIVERGSTADFRVQPRHPYSQALLRAVPTLDPDQPLMPSPNHPPCEYGCPWAPCCSRTDARCLVEFPELSPFGGGLVRCHHPVTSHD